MSLGCLALNTGQYLQRASVHSWVASDLLSTACVSCSSGLDQLPPRNHLMDFLRTILCSVYAGVHAYSSGRQMNYSATAWLICWS